jgi:lipopolysaccharide biosynthesis regulator YciM
MEEFLVILVPAAAALGWWGGRWYYTQKFLVRHTQAIRQGYCKGLNYLLSEKTDKAIETFANLLASDIETIETHVALGNLFRRRGEVQKAIEIHEELLARQTLTGEQKTAAQFELGLDYLRAGLYDRAELILANLADYPSHRRPALELLLQIYQQEKDWTKARSCVGQLSRIGRTPRGESEAQLLCELADEALKARQYAVADGCLDEALGLDPCCLRAVLMKADLLARDGYFRPALDLLKTVESIRPAYLPEILKPLIRCHDQLGLPRNELSAYLDRLSARCRHPQIAIALAELVAADQGQSEALAYLREAATAHPSIRLMAAMVRFLAKADATGEQRAVYQGLGESLDQLVQRQPRYRCSQCGFSGQELHWRCPSCRHWDTTVPLD